MLRIDLNLLTFNFLGLNYDFRADRILFDNFDPLFVKVQRFKPQILSECYLVSILVKKVHLDLIVVLLNENVRVC